MLKKIAVGTANFTQPYGVLSPEKKALDKKIVQSILYSAQQAGINTFDTAFGYGNFLNILPENFSFKDSRIITKFNVLDSYDEILSQVKMIYDQYSLVYEGLLIHDPQNLSCVDEKELCRFFENVKTKGYVKKIGVSVYDLKEFEAFKKIVKPDLVQIPLNPFNQTFKNSDFIDYIQDNNIEVHARSLFLQGVLLSDNAPPLLGQLAPFLEKFNHIAKEYSSKLGALLMCANAQNFVQKWVLGLASLENLNTLMDQMKHVQVLKDESIFDCFSATIHPSVDPRNWCKL